MISQCIGKMAPQITRGISGKEETQEIVLTYGLPSSLTPHWTIEVGRGHERVFFYWVGNWGCGEQRSQSFILFVLVQWNLQIRFFVAHIELAV